MNKGIFIRVPARICLFGDHQDYLNLPTIACAINKYIFLEAHRIPEKKLDINFHNLNERREVYLDDLENSQINIHLINALRILKDYNCILNDGYEVKIYGDIPINAGLSSSSALVIAWICFLLTASGIKRKFSKSFIADVAYRAEVAMCKAPGGRMDQYSIALGNISYLNNDEPIQLKIFNGELKNLIISESGIPKDTTGVLKDTKEKAIAAINMVKSQISQFKIENVQIHDIPYYLQLVSFDYKPYLEAAINNYLITMEAVHFFNQKKFSFEEIGRLMNKHHNILKDKLDLTLPSIDQMIEIANNAGAYGSKIVGSGRGGCIVILAPIDRISSIINNLKSAGFKNTYQVKTDMGIKVKNFNNAL